MTISTKTIGEKHVAYLRHTGAYSPQATSGLFNQLIAWAHPKGYLEKTRMLTVYWDDPDVKPMHKCRSDAAIYFPHGLDVEEPIQTGHIPGGEYAINAIRISESEFEKAWDDTFFWLDDNGYEYDDARPCIEEYKSNSQQNADGLWEIYIYVPVKSVDN